MGLSIVVLVGIAIVTLVAFPASQHVSFADKTSVLPSQTRHYTIIAQDTTIEIAPGVRVEAWTYNGTIPGPTIRATEGDRVIIDFINNGHLPHTIHLHGDHNEKNDGVFQEVLPGQSYTYDFVAEPAGAFMYHCHVMPVSEHIRNGLYGAMIIDPKVAPAPAREFVLVKGEYDLDDQESWEPDYVFFNGYADQYWNNPLQAKTDELVRIYYVDMGAMPAFGYHIHGTVFDAIASGIWQNPPVKAQTWEVSPGNAAIFEASWEDPGRYLFHLHGLPEERGTMAYFDVSDASDGAIDGVDVAKTKSIYMWQDQLALLTRLQASDTDGTVIPSSRPTSTESHQNHFAQTPATIQTTTCEIENGSAMKSSNKSYYPQQIQVNAGDTVQWKNSDNSIHTVTGEEFDSGMLMAQDTFEYTFESAGLYEYYCTLHPWMRGAVQVI
ncbi:multicopper oxidase domain-containing protein [Candidatus Nitrosotenuis aquarius]|uniref:multicopper oxidase domain-containing protein n=1 Tax=Candidatus Nitrosotenuis aquarius TaxID=1846278 RepID=UPI001FE2A9B7|nr:multicopper oxidase domain-containing protein [Candidatus Nitrosotenuis aquarius]